MRFMVHLLGTSLEGKGPDRTRSGQRFHETTEAARQEAHGWAGGALWAYLLGAAVVLSLLVVPVATAEAASDSGEPQATTSASAKKGVKKLNRKLKQLARELDALERQPGPEGPVGPRGERGPQGPPGISTGPAGGDLAGSYPNPVIADAAVTTPKLGADAVNSAKVLNGSVALADLAGDSVNSAKVVDNSLTGTDVDESTLAGLWRLGGNSGVGAGEFLGTTDDSPLDFWAGNARALRLQPTFNGNAPAANVLGGSPDNSVSPGVHSATIGGGGRSDSANPDTANRVTDSFGTVGGGARNQAGNNAGETGGAFAAVGGGVSNVASGSGATVGGGSQNNADAPTATVGGGGSNAAVGLDATVSGGLANEAPGEGAVVPGGHLNTAAGLRSFAAGYRARASHQGAFVWADSQDVPMGSSATNQFIARAQGRFFLQSDSSLDDQGGFINTSTGAFLSNGGAWTNASDENLKAGFEGVDPREVLKRVDALPVRSWHYKGEPSVRHVGPVAQDFYRAFEVGSDNRHIASVDADGIALAAIKGLQAELRAERRRRIGQERRIARLQNRLVALERGPR